MNIYLSTLWSPYRPLWQPIYHLGDQRVSALLESIANTISTDIQMEEDYPSNHENLKLPILDIQVWVELEEGKPTIMMTFYKKPMAKSLTIIARSAFSKQKKWTVLKVEALRRLRNCTPNEHITTKGELLTRLAINMRNSGHTTKFREIVLKTALTKHLAEVQDWKDGKSPIYRNKVEREKAKANREKEGGSWTMSRGYNNTFRVPTIHPRGRSGHHGQEHHQSQPCRWHQDPCD